MTNQLVSEAEVEKALDWLRDNAHEIGEAKREAVKTEYMIRHVKALAMKLHPALPVSAQEREAYASEQYLTAIDNVSAAAGEFEKLKSLREAATLKIEAWRSMGANYRAMKI
jgi:hypothetical protein